jgi:hypothetical protein
VVHTETLVLALTPTPEITLATQTQKHWLQKKPGCMVYLDKLHNTDLSFLRQDNEGVMQKL